MNYQEMSDEEINKLVARSIGPSYAALDDCVVHIVNNVWTEFDPCNLWGDVGTIAEENFISFDQHYNGSYAKVWGYSNRGLHEVSVLRSDLKKGICIVFLMMKGGD